MEEYAGTTCEAGRYMGCGTLWIIFVRATRTTTDLEQKKQNSNRHKSISESLIKEVPVIEVDGTVAMCDGGTYHNLFPFKISTRSENAPNAQTGGGATGHPVEYIQLNTTDGSKPQTCKYCGLRFVQKAH